MFDLSPFIDLPLVWGGLIAFAVFLYVLLDGFDLGVGILFPFAPSHPCRDKMMHSIAPFWDGNETWLVMGGAGLFAAFPLAYAVLLPAFYLPVILMLLGLIFRGVAFEFRFKASERGRRYWDYAFHFGSLAAGFFQGVILGTFVQGVPVADRSFAGGSFDWLTPFSLMTGAALVSGYALLGATWVILKTDGKTQEWARKCAEYALIYVVAFMGLVSLWVPFLDPEIATRWFSWPNLLYLSPVPLAVVGVTFALAMGLRNGREHSPFFLSVALFTLGYAGLAISLYPYIVPRSLTLAAAAAAPESQSLLLAGAALVLPLVLAYTAYCFYVFRGKSGEEELY